jgi:hypothetical protein
VIVIGSYIIVVNAVNDKQRKIEANNEQLSYNSGLLFPHYNTHHAWDYD